MANSPTVLASVEKTINILYALKENNGLRVSEVANLLDIPTSTAHVHLSTLYESEFVSKEGDQYVLGTICAELGEHVKYRTKAYRIAEQYTKTIFEETGYRSVFMIEEHGRGVYLHTYSGDQNEWKHEKSGTREPLHTTAAGKAILAQLPADRVNEIIEKENFSERTSNTITDKETLHEELATVRERQFAKNDEENLDGIRAVGVPILNPMDEVIGAFSVAGAANRMTDTQFDETLPKNLLAIVNEYKLELFIGDEN